EYVEGRNLDHLLTGQPLQPQTAAELIEVLAGTMAAAHQKGIVHRDLKPANILLAADPRRETQIEEEKTVGAAASSSLCVPLRPAAAKITDFGLARDLASPSRLTAAGDVFGTPRYMAPEQARGDGNLLGPAVDIYALGAILYECLTGRPPSAGATQLDVL